MVVVHRAHGFRFVIYTQDHEPAHVHVTGPGQAKIDLLGPGGVPRAVYSIGIKRADMRRLMDEVAVHREHFLAEWERIHGAKDYPREDDLAAAEARGEALLDGAPRASAVRYDAPTGRVTIDLANGCAYSFPARLVEDLQGATDERLALIEIDGLGLNLHWPALDVDLFVPALIDGVFGTRAWMTRELARRAGAAKSPAKAAAARANGAKGGRPRKAAAG